jgi:twinkle protein
LPFNRGFTQRMSKESMLEGNAWVADRFAFILPESPGVDTILDLARVQVFRNGVRGVVVDPWNELEHARPHHLSETEYISEALTKFRRFARHHDVHLWIVAHPKKMERKADGSESVPGLWDVSGSAHFRNKADVGITVWRDVPANDNTVDVHITKVRFSDSGRLGKVRFGYEAASKRLYSIGGVE